MSVLEPFRRAVVGVPFLYQKVRRISKFPSDCMLIDIRVGVFGKSGDSLGLRALS